MNIVDPAFSGLGFAVGTVRGVRSFRIWDEEDLAQYVQATVDDVGLLTGMYFRQTWRPGLNEAMCHKAGPTSSVNQAYHAEPRDWRVPTLGHLGECGCGFHAYYDGSNDYFDPHRHGSNLVTGVVEGSGEVVVGMRGFRCTRARIVALLTVTYPEDLAVRWSAYAGIALFDTFDEMITEYPNEDGGARAEYRRRLEEAS